MSAPPKTKKAAAKPTHPPFAVMVLAAMRKLRSTQIKVSRASVAKLVIADNNLTDTAKATRLVGQALKRLAAKGVIIRCSGTGASGSFKLPPKSSEKAKKPAAKKAAKKPAAKKAAKSPAKKAAKKASTPKKAAAKKPAAKKAPAKKASTPKKSPAKKPAAKKPAAKKPAAKKAPAKKPAAKKPAAKKGGK